MGYIEPSTRKVNKNKKPLVDTIVSKKFWVLLNTKGRLFYNRDGSILMFSRRKDATDYLADIIDDKSKDYGDNWDARVKIEKLDVIITR